MDDLKKKLDVDRLFSHYQVLLTAKQRDLVIAYYHDDLSLGEIAERDGVSRNAVFDQLKKTVKKLEDFEAKLHLASREEKRVEIIKAMEKASDDKRVNALLEALKGVD